MRVDRETVWEAYAALLRYIRCNERPPIAGAPVPEGLTEKPSGRALEACSDVAFLLTHKLETHPLDASPLYYAYLFLFVQLLRVSRPYGPSFKGNPRGWSPLVWLPLHVLRGRDDVAERAWHRWYHRNVRTQNPEPTEDTLWSTYPLFAPYADVALVAVADQLPSFVETRETYGLSLRDTVVNVAPGGHPKQPWSRAFWHPWLITALPDAWERRFIEELPTECIGHLRTGVLAMLNDTVAGLRFVQEAIPFVNSATRRQGSISDASLMVIRDGIGSFVRQHLPGRQGHWRNRIRRHFPDNGRIRCASLERDLAAA